MASGEMSKKLRRGLIITAVVFLAAVTVTVSVWVFRAGPNDVFIESQNAQKALNAYRRAGLPWEATDLLPAPHVKPEDNAAVDITAALNGPDFEPFDRDLPILIRRGEERDWKKVDEGLRKYAPLLYKVTRAAEKSQLVFDRDYDQGINIGYPELLCCKDGVKGICLRAKMSAVKNDLLAATSDLTYAFKLAALQAEDSTVIALAVQCQEETIALEAVQYCATYFASNPKAIELLQGMVSRYSRISDIGRSFRGEIYLGLATIRNLNNGEAENIAKSRERPYQGDQQSNQEPRQIIRTGLPKNVYVRALMTRHMEVWTDAKHRMDTDVGDPESTWQDLKAISDQLKSRPTYSKVLLIDIFPTYCDVVESVVRVEATVQVTNALLSSLEYRIKTGTLPNKLGDIGNWTDPFTKHPLTFRKIGPGFRVYSLGPNQMDDRGLTKTESNGGSDDIVAIYRPALPPVPHHPKPTQ